MDKFNKNSGFKTPEDYFGSFTDKLMGKLSELDSDRPKKEGFKVPDGYFDSLHHHILQKLDHQGAKVVRLHPYRKYYFIAASVAAIVLFGLALNLNTISYEVTFDDLASTDIESYFDNNDMELTTYEIAEVIPIDELEINDILNEQINEDQIIEYLDETVDEFEELNLKVDDY